MDKFDFSSDDYYNSSSIKLKDMSYCIVKMVPNIHNVELPVIILDIHEEVLEFETLGEAEKFANILEKNSDSGYKYLIKKV